MATFVFTLLLLSVCCVGCIIAEVQTHPGPGKTNKDDMTTATSTNSSETDLQPPPWDDQLAARLSDHILKLQELTQGKRGAEEFDFLRCGIETTQQLEAISKALYCMNGRKVPRDCQDAYKSGLKRSGVYKVSPDGVKQFDVYCDQETDGGGWAVIQRRVDGSVDFYREWADYKKGFGNAAGEYWVGNDNLHLLTAKHDQKLKVELKYGYETRSADYSDFSIGNEKEKYKLAVSGYSGTAGDALTSHSGFYFTTKDKDSDTYNGRNCAEYCSGAWWYNKCGYVNLNGVYGASSTYHRIYWATYKGYVSLSRVRMMLKSK